MVGSNTIRKIILSMEGTEETAHFERRAFKITGKQIFASILESKNSANIKLNLKDQETFCGYNKKHIYPVPNKFGNQGWTTFDLDHLPEEIVGEALHAAYAEVLIKKSTSIKKK